MHKASLDLFEAARNPTTWPATLGFVTDGAVAVAVGVDTLNYCSRRCDEKPSVSPSSTSVDEKVARGTAPNSEYWSITRWRICQHIFGILVKVTTPASHNADDCIKTNTLKGAKALG